MQAVNITERKCIFVLNLCGREANSSPASYLCFFNGQGTVVKSKASTSYQKRSTDIVMQTTLSTLHCRQVIEGAKVLALLEEQETFNERPKSLCVIVDCGLFDVESLWNTSRS